MELPLRSARPGAGQTEGTIRSGEAGAQQVVRIVPIPESRTEKKLEDRAHRGGVGLGAGEHTPGRLEITGAASIREQSGLGGQNGQPVPFGAAVVADDGAESPPGVPGEGFAPEEPEVIIDESAGGQTGIRRETVFPGVESGQVSAGQLDLVGCGPGEIGKVNSAPGHFRLAVAIEPALIPFSIAGLVPVRRMERDGIRRVRVGPDSVGVGKIAVGRPGSEVRVVSVGREASGVGRGEVSNQNKCIGIFWIRRAGAGNQRAQLRGSQIGRRIQAGDFPTVSPVIGDHGRQFGRKRSREG